MKKMLMAVLAGAMMAFVGCGDKETSSGTGGKAAVRDSLEEVQMTDPVRTLEAFMNAVLEADVETAVALSRTPKELEEVSEEDKELVGKILKRKAAEAEISHVKIKSISLKEKTEDSAAVEVVTESDDGLEHETMSLRFVEGKWYLR